MNHDHHDHDHDHEHEHEHPSVEHEAKVDQVGSRVTMKIIISAKEASSNIDEVSNIFRERAKMQGFRRGKAPINMIRQRYRDEIRENVLDQLIPLHVGNAIKARGLKPIHNPMLEDVNFEPGHPLTFTAKFDVQPEVEIAGYKNLAASKIVRPVEDKAVDSAVSNMREQAAKLESVEDGGILAGDYAIVKIALFPRDGKGKKLAEEERFVHVGEERSIPSLNTQLEELKKGDTRKFVTKLGESYPNDLLADKEVTCRVEVQEIKRRHLPPVDNDLARDLGFADLSELREKTKENYAAHLEEDAQRDVARQLMDQVIAANPVDPPESLIEARLDHSMQRAAEDLARQGVDPRHSVDWEAYRAENEPHAKRAVTEEILFGAIVNAEGIEIEDAEVLVEIEKHQEGQPEGTAASVAQRMRQDGSFDGLRLAMLRRLALDLVKSHATIETVEAGPESTTENDS
ncbi:MAG: trigger factor [Acidobacteriota bacterium]|jgi:trigger factor|nr:trigger factor [Acidobacteriota bacterium]